MSFLNPLGALADSADAGKPDLQRSDFRHVALWYAMPIARLPNAKRLYYAHMHYAHMPKADYARFGYPENPEDMEPAESGKTQMPE